MAPGDVAPAHIVFERIAWGERKGRVAPDLAEKMRAHVVAGGALTKFDFASVYQETAARGLAELAIDMPEKVRAADASALRLVERVAVLRVRASGGSPSADVPRPMTAPRARGPRRRRRGTARGRARSPGRKSAAADGGDPDEPDFVEPPARVLFEHAAHARHGGVRWWLQRWGEEVLNRW
jgi:hypothetical protein